MEIRLLEYLTEEGRSPFGEWLLGLADRRGRAVIQNRLDRIRLGNWGDVEPVGKGVSELRVHFGPGYRVYLARAGADSVVLLAGGDKSTQNKDITQAREHWRRFKEQENG